MLEFEETSEQYNKPMKAEVTAPAGFVVVPIEQYNDLLLAARSTPRIKVERGMFNKDEIDIKIDTEWLHVIATELLITKYGLEALRDFNIVPVDDIYFSPITIAKRRPQEHEAL